FLDLGDRLLRRQGGGRGVLRQRRRGQGRQARQDAGGQQASPDTSAVHKGLLQTPTHSTSLTSKLPSRSGLHMEEYSCGADHKRHAACFSSQVFTKSTQKGQTVPHPQQLVSLQNCK